MKVVLLLEIGMPLFACHYHFLSVSKYWKLTRNLNNLFETEDFFLSKTYVFSYKIVFKEIIRGQNLVRSRLVFHIAHGC
jgi:hypothetical protein